MFLRYGSCFLLGGVIFVQTGALSAFWLWQEVAESVKEDFGSIDILVHSLANGPEVHLFHHVAVPSICCAEY